MSYAIYGKDSKRLVEGGFFSRDAAEESCRIWNEENEGGEEFVVRKQERSR